MKRENDGEKLEAVFAQASSQFCGHIDEYLIRHTRHLGETYYKGAQFCSNIRDEDFISYSYADKIENDLHDERNDCGGVHPFAASRESVVVDFGRVRMLAQEVSAELLRTLRHGERASVREESVALIAVAKRFGIYIPYQSRGQFGDLKRRVLGENEVYAGTDFILHNPQMNPNIIISGF